MKFKQFIKENKEAIVLWHGGSLDDGYNETQRHKKGRWEYGPGLYLTTHYETAKKYAKGSRRLYRITVEKGNNIKDMSLSKEKIFQFVNTFVKNNKRKETKNRLEKHTKDGLINADIFLNILINGETILGKYTNELRTFFVDNGIDYSLESNVYGWNELMLVLFNMNKIINKEVITDKTKIETFDLPKEFVRL